MIRFRWTQTDSCLNPLHLPLLIIAYGLIHQRWVMFVRLHLTSFHRLTITASLLRQHTYTKRFMNNPRLNVHESKLRPPCQPSRYVNLFLFHICKENDDSFLLSPSTGPERKTWGQNHRPTAVGFTFRKGQFLNKFVFFFLNKKSVHES